MENDSPIGLFEELESAELCVRALMDAAEIATPFERPMILRELRNATDAYVALALAVISCSPIAPEKSHA